MPPFTFSPVAASDTDALSAMFGRAGSACFCRYWHFTGDKNAWLDRLAHSPEENARELAHDLRSADPSSDGVDALRGVVARAPDRTVVGWMKLSAVERLRKLYEQRLYRRLPCFEGDRAGIVAVGCFLVDPAHRRQGVASGLLDAAIRIAQAAGARAIEAFPRRAELLGDEESWMGPFSVFTKHGFEIVHDFGPYPVMRRNL